jgi:hypothetical protein
MHRLGGMTGIHPWQTASAKKNPQNVSRMKSPKDIKVCRTGRGRLREAADLVEIIVLPDKFLELRLNVDYPLGREVKLDHRHARLLEVPEKAHLRRLQKHQTASFSVGAPRRTPNAMDIIPRVVRRIILDDPIHGRNLQSRIWVRSRVEKGGSKGVYARLTHGPQHQCR